MDNPKKPNHPTPSPTNRAKKKPAKKRTALHPADVQRYTLFVGIIVAWVGLCLFLTTKNSGGESGGGIKPLHSTETPESVYAKGMADFEKDAAPIRSQSATYQIGLKRKAMTDLLMAGNYAELQRLALENYNKDEDTALKGDVLSKVFESWGEHTKAKWKDIILKIDGWVEAYPESSIPYTARAITYYHYAWEERGDKFVKETKDSQMQNYAALLQVGFDDVTKALKLDPNNRAAWRTSVDYGFLLGGRDYGLATFARANERFPDHFSIYARMLNFMMDRWFGENGEQIAIIRGLIDRDPKNPMFHLLFLTNVQWEAGWQVLMGEEFAKDQSVVGHLRKSFNKVNFPKTTAEFYANPKVWADITASVKFLSDDPNYRYAAADEFSKILFDLGYRDQALESCKLAIEHDPCFSYGALGSLISHYEDNNKFLDLAPYALKNAACQPNDANTHEHLAYSYVKMDARENLASENRKHALAHYLKTVELDPQNAGALGNACWDIFVLFGKKEAERALTYCNAAIAINPKDDMAFDWRSHIYWELGKRNEANADHAMVLKLRGAAQNRR